MRRGRAAEYAGPTLALQVVARDPQAPRDAV